MVSHKDLFSPDLLVMRNILWHLFIFLISHLLLSDHFLIFCPFCFYWVVFLWLFCKSSLYWLLMFDCYIYGKYFPPASWLSFKIVYEVFFHIEVSNLPVVKYIDFSSLLLFKYFLRRPFLPLGYTVITVNFLITLNMYLLVGLFIGLLLTCNLYFCMMWRI